MLFMKSTNTLFLKQSLNISINQSFDVCLHSLKVQAHKSWAYIQRIPTEYVQDKIEHLLVYVKGVF